MSSASGPCCGRRPRRGEHGTARRPVLRHAGRVARLVRCQPCDRRRAVARLLQEGQRTARASTGRRWSTRRCASAGSTASASGSTTRSASSASRRAARGSTWSAINVAKVATLTAEGRMRPAGQAAFEARTEANTAIYSYERPHGALTDDEEARFRADAAAWADWERRPTSYRRATMHWVTSAKQAATRERRLATLIEDSRAGRPLKQLAWNRKSHDRRRMTPSPTRSTGSDGSSSATRSSRGPPRRSSRAGSIAWSFRWRRAGSAARMADAAEVLLALGAIDGSTALGFAMQVHVIGALVDSMARAGWTSRRGLFARSWTDGRARQQRRDRGGRRIAGARRDPGHDRGRPRRTGRGG